MKKIKDKKMKINELRKRLEKIYPDKQFILRKILPVTILPWLFHWRCFSPRIVFYEYTKSNEVHPKGYFNWNTIWICPKCGDIDYTQHG